MPPRPELPLIDPSALNCVPQPDYEKLVERDVRLQAHIRRLEALLETTHETD